MEERRQKRLDFLSLVLCVAAVWGLTYLTWRYLAGWLLPLAAGYAIAMVVHPAAARIAKGRSVSASAVGYLLLALAYTILLLALLALGALLVVWFQRLLFQLPSLYRDVFLPAAGALDAMADRILERISPDLAGSTLLQGAALEMERRLLSLLTKGLGRLGSMGGQLPEAILACLFSIICSIIIMGCYQEINTFVARQLTPHGKQLLQALKAGVTRSLSSILKRFCFLTAVCALELAAGLWLLGVQHWLALSVLISFFDLLPLLGVGSILLPWSGICFIQGKAAMAAGLLALWGIVSITHGILELRMTGAQLKLHPLVGITAIYLGYQAAGMWGMLLLPILCALVLELQREGLVQIWK